MIVPMKRLTLVALTSDEDAILRALQDTGAVEPVSLNEGEQKSPALEAAEARVSELAASQSAVRAYAKKAGMLTPLRRETHEALLSAEAAAKAASDEIRQLSERRSALNAEYEKSRSTLDALRPWLDFKKPMESVKNSPAVHYFLGLVSVRDIDRLRETDFLVTETYCEGSTIAALVCCHESDVRAANVFFKSIDWQDVVFPKLNGTPAAASLRLETRLAEINAELDSIAKALAERAAVLPTLENGEDASRIECAREQAACKVAHTTATFAMEGWLRGDDTDKVEKAIGAVTPAYYLAFRDPTEDETPPSVVQNNVFNTPFEAVNDLYSKPDPRGIDATPFMAPWYILLFGMMLSDTGYGLLLVLGTAIYIKLKKPTGMSGGIARVLFYGGLSTIVWGVLIGTFFGVDFNNIFGTAGVFPLIMNPLDEPIQMLIICFALGIVHMLCGYCIRIGMCLKRHDWQSALFDNVSWILIILGLIAFALPSFAAGLPAVISTIGLAAASLGAFFIVFFKARAKRNPIKRVVSGLGGLYDVTSILSDVLSYARLFALGIATGVIASVFNDICGMLMGGSGVMGVVGFILACALLVVLHLFNLSINTLGAFVHCARLQYVEFYGKFYEAGGRPFKPLAYRTKHSVVEK